MMPRFSARTLALVQRNTEAMMTDTCTIEREAAGKGLMGEPVGGWTLVAQDVPCRVISIGRGAGRSSYQEVGSQEALVERYRLICPKATAFAVDDRVTISGTTYLIIDLIDGWTDSVFVGAVMVGA
jgi:hypothetical protein